MQSRSEDLSARPGNAPWYGRLYVQVVTAIAAGITVGLIWPDVGSSLQPLGDGFVKLVKMIIAPVIFLTIVTGIGGLKQAGDIGRVAGKAFAYFLRCLLWRSLSA